MPRQPSLRATKKRKQADAKELDLKAADPEPSTPRGASEGRARPPVEATSAPQAGVSDYRHDESRRNNPPAGLAELEAARPRARREYSFDPHLDPQLAWAGKAEHGSFEVETVSLHIQERISARAIIAAVRREPSQRSLFADEALPTAKAVDFYAHDVDWSNRLVLGDSLIVMNSLLERERMAGQVQCVFMDPPYGVNYRSNFQPQVSRTDVKEDDSGIGREPEQIQAYRDTWELGVHSYLTYLRDRFLLARELLSDTGSIFLQISDENVHQVREVLDEVFGAKNFVALIPFRKKTMPLGANFIEQMADFILWYAKRKSDGQGRPFAKYRQLYRKMDYGPEDGFGWCELSSGERIRASDAVARFGKLPPDARLYTLKSLEPSGPMPSGMFRFEFEGTEYDFPKNGYGTTPDGMKRLARAGRLQPSGRLLRYVLFAEDKPLGDMTAPWQDTVGADDKAYVVQTNTEVVRRCLLMTTDPGDLVLDPTCGSGTTAYVAEQWGRRWITCDTSRVALAVARQRLLTAKYPYFRLRAGRVRDGFVYRTAPHITVKSIAQNQRLDECETRAECERIISETAGSETLVDQPEEDRDRVRVSGPFTVEGLPSLALESVPEAGSDGAAGRADFASDFVTHMIDLLRKSGGVHFRGNKTLPLPTLRPVRSASEWLHAECDGAAPGDPRRIAISFGPAHGAVTPKQVLEAIQQTRGYDLVLFIGFACDPEATRIIDQGVRGRELQFVHAAPDILVRDLLKTSKANKLFTAFGLPDVRVHKADAADVTVELRGVDLYDPTTGETRHESGQNVAAWFLDHDYDGRTFLVCQAFFPGARHKDPWERLQRALRAEVDPSKFEALRGTRSLPFTPGRRIAVKVIDDRGNEVVKVASAAP